MASSQIHNEVDTLRGNASQRLFFADARQNLNTILPPPTSGKQYLTKNGSRDTAWHDTPCGVPASLCTITSN